MSLCPASFVATEGAPARSRLRNGRTGQPVSALMDARCGTLAPQPDAGESSRVGLPRVGERRLPAIWIDHSKTPIGPVAKRAEVQMRRPAASGVTREPDSGAGGDEVAFS